MLLNEHHQKYSFQIFTGNVKPKLVYTKYYCLGIGTRCLTSSEIRRVVLTVLSSFLRQSCLY